MPKTKRMSMTIPESVFNDLEYVSKHLRVSRSSLISEILASNISSIRGVVEQCVPDTTDTPEGHPALSRDPDKVRSYLDSLSAALTQAQNDFETQRTDLYKAMDGTKNEH